MQWQQLQDESCSFPRGEEQFTSVDTANNEENT